MCARLKGHSLALNFGFPDDGPFFSDVPERINEEGVSCEGHAARCGRVHKNNSLIRIGCCNGRSSGVQENGFCLGPDRSHVPSSTRSWNFEPIGGATIILFLIKSDGGGELQI